MSRMPRLSLPATRVRSRRGSVILMVGVLLAGTAITAGAAQARQEPGPIHAGNTFGWYHKSNTWRQEFVGTLPSFWRKQGNGNMHIINGMLTVGTTHGTVTATLDQPGHRTGRWEIRMKSRHTDRGREDYRIVTALIPRKASAYRCGAQNIALEDYRVGTNRARFYIRTKPDLTFQAAHSMDLGNEKWHTYAVEVAENHVSWFVDAHVIRTERRPKALSGIPLTVQFALVPPRPHAKMNPARMQMDWLRYWSYNRPSTRSIKAPRTTKATYHQACGREDAPKKPGKRNPKN